MFNRMTPCCVTSCASPLQGDGAESSFGLDVVFHLHNCSFSSNVKVPVQPFPHQRHAQELLTRLQTPNTDLKYTTPPMFTSPKFIPVNKDTPRRGLTDLTSDMKSNLSSHLRFCCRGKTQTDCWKDPVAASALRPAA